MPKITFFSSKRGQFVVYLSTLAVAEAMKQLIVGWQTKCGLE